VRLSGPTLRYDVVGVFTDRAFAGNPLAVVHGAQDLAGEQMLAIAREFNLSETAFPLPPTSAGAHYRVRIFTPLTELPFAGLPGIGTAWLLAATGRIAPGDAVQQSDGGLHAVHTEEHSATLIGGEPLVGQHLDAPALAIACGLVLSDVDTVASAGVAGAGMDFSFLPVRADSVARAVPKPAEITENAVGRGVVPVAFDAERRTTRTRMFRASGGEDPATGAAHSHSVPGWWTGVSCQATASRSTT
jgi:trans-2,3-dihydro-3-hydroxyanthranilate isomerase